MKRFTLLAVLLTAFCFITKADPTNYLTFNGSDQYVNIPTTDDLSMTTSESLTVSFWVKCSNYSSTPRVISNRYNMVDTNGAIDIFYGSSGCAIMYLYPDDEDTDPMNTFLGGGTDGSWVHIAGVMDRTTGVSYGYADGSLEYTGTLLSGFYIQPTISTLLGTSRDSSGDFAYYLNGAIANVRYYKSALSADEIAADMAANSYSELSDDLKSSCVAAYDLNDYITSLALTDATGRGNDGTLVNYDLSVEIEERTITVESADSTMGTVSGGETSTTDVTIVATANTGYKFVSWTLDGAVVSTDATYIDTTTGDKTYVANFEVVEAYCTTDESTTGSNGRGLTSLALTADGSTTTVSVNQGTSGTRDVYYDLTSTKVTVEAGSEVSLSLSWTGYWMHGYLYIDYNKDIVFTPELNDEGTPTADSELVSFTYYSSSEASYGVNSAGVETYYGEGLASDALPSFIIPATTPAGEYRARFNIDWCSIDPCGTGDMGANEGAMVDFIISVETQVVVVSTETSGRGSVTINGEAVTSLDVEAESAVELVAIPEDGSEFVRWEELVNGEVVATTYDATYSIESISAYVNLRAVFAYTSTRFVMVMSNDNEKGTASILSPASDYSSVMTGEDVTVLATVAGGDNVFVNWTIDDEIVSTSAEYTYTGADFAYIFANFSSSYTVDILSTTNGTLSATVDGGSLSSGTKVAEGTEVVITASTTAKYELQQLLINGENVIDQVVNNQYTLTVTEETTVSALFGEVVCTISYSWTGGGYIEVWSSEDYGSDGYSSTPAGTQYGQGSAATYGTNIYIFPFEENGTVESILVNGEECIYDITIDGYSSVEYTVLAPISIVAVFSGETTGIESADADAVSVYTVSGGVKVITSAATAVEVYTITGSQIVSVQVSGAETIALEAGIYLVKAEGKVSKVIVK